MVSSVNQVVNVVSLNRSMLAKLLNNCVAVNTANRKYDYVMTIPGQNGQYGRTLQYTVPPDAVIQYTLGVNFTNTNFPTRTISVDRYRSAAYAFNMSDYQFNTRTFMQDYGSAHAAALGQSVESDILTVAVKNCYRYFGDGINSIGSFQQMALATTIMTERGDAEQKKAYISATMDTQMVSSGMNLFRPVTNDQMGKKWTVGNYQDVDYYKSRRLPILYAGNAGNDQLTLTVLSFVQDADGFVTQITFSGAGTTDPEAIHKYDKATFLDNVSGFPNIRFMAKYDPVPVDAPVQFMATAASGSDGSGHVSVNIFPGLKASTGLGQNISSPIQVGMQVTFLPTCRLGFMTMGDALYLVNPPLPDQDPYKTSFVRDPNSGVGLQMVTGAQFNSGDLGNIHRIWYGYDLVPDYGYALAIPYARGAV